MTKQRQHTLRQMIAAGVILSAVLLNTGCNSANRLANQTEATPSLGASPAIALTKAAQNSSQEPTPMLEGEAASYLWIELPADDSFEQTSGGFDPVDGNRWETHTGNDGVVEIAIVQVSRQAATDDQSRYSQISQAIEGVDESTFTITASPEASSAYTYPVHVFEFEATFDAITYCHLDLYFETDNGGYVVDMAANAEDWADQLSAINNWLQHLELVDIPTI
ncbi:MAG: hypothetical protein LBG70_00310 [Bifidobacteriaceae bacterium]|nr:hypothetical protein [Bifidobacteriaceae bacterium]